MNGAASRFNGAATLPPRKHRAENGDLRGSRRFNGAATLPPRKRRRSPTIETPFTSLQRSRDVAAAETVGGWGRFGGGNRLQRSRDVAAAETSERSSIAIGSSPLQRSRDVAAAETQRADAQSAFPLRFNGAATLPPRKLARRSMSPNCIFVASTEPRRCRRGNPSVTTRSRTARNSFNGAATLPPRKQRETTSRM